MHRVATAVRKPNSVTAAYAAGLVLAVMVAQQLANAVYTIAFYGNSGQLGLWLGGLGFDFLTVRLPFALGVFLSFWLVARIVAEHRMTQVVARSLAAAGIGAVAVFVASFLFEAMARLSEVSWFGHSLSGVAGALAQSGNYAIAVGWMQAVNALIYAAPVVVLAGVCLWFWLTKRPAQQPAEGILDEV
ncbi:hypothetical protein [Cryobacterium sp. BB736]|uniref:hypothetical protein n=1 Tax=Cryobacterium sp. BB736 TaxID=2746963 RepID=UPI00187410CA|nr:hypothetical protein [Cryobacterium sp. BB736]